MASKESEILITLYQSISDRMAANPNLDLGTIRDMFESLHLAATEPEGVTYVEVNANGVPGIMCIPEGGAQDRVMLHSHAGGTLVLSMHSDRKMAGHFAKAIGIRCLVIDYRRSPENKFPAQLEDVVTAYRWLLSQGFRPEHIVSGGHSIGGLLCTTMALKARQEGLPLPAAIVAVSAWYDMEMRGETFETNAKSDAVVSRELLGKMRSALLDGTNTPYNHPLLDIYGADLKGMPPIMLHAGGWETLLSDSIELEKVAKAAGVEVSLTVAKEMQHSYLFLAGRAPEAIATMKEISDWVRPKLGLPPL